MIEHQTLNLLWDRSFNFWEEIPKKVKELEF
jgi:hypothetical protein